jgi:hypothetical protein
VEEVLMTAFSDVWDETAHVRAEALLIPGIHLHSCMVQIGEDLVAC